MNWIIPLFIASIMSGCDRNSGARYSDAQQNGHDNVADKVEVGDGAKTPSDPKLFDIEINGLGVTFRSKAPINRRGANLTKVRWYLGEVDVAGAGAGRYVPGDIPVYQSETKNVVHLYKAYRAFPVIFQAFYSDGEILTETRTIDLVNGTVVDTVASELKVTSLEAAKEIRKEAINYIWHDDKGEFSTKNGFRLDQVLDPIYGSWSLGKAGGGVDLSRFQNLEKAVGLKFKGGPWNTISWVLYLIPKNNIKNRLVLYHQGHGTFNFRDSWKMMRDLVDNGFHVMGFHMPGRATNISDLPNYQSHNSYAVYESSDYSGLRDFLEPVIRALDWADKNAHFEDYSMIGFSGGAWVTDIVSALDTRINNSFSIGSYTPWYMTGRYTRGGGDPVTQYWNLADFENGGGGGGKETTPAHLYMNIMGTVDMQAMKADFKGRNAYVYCNLYDDAGCRGWVQKSWGDEIAQWVEKRLEGRYSMVINTLNKDHRIGEWTRKDILVKLLDSRRDKHDSADDSQ